MKSKRQSARIKNWDRKIGSDRKGAISSPLVLVVAVIVYLGIFFAFYFIYGVIGLSMENQLLSETKDLDNTMIFLNYLKTPVSVGGERMLISELILLAYESGKHKSVLVDKTEQILSIYPEKYWRISLYKAKDNDFYDVDGAQLLFRIEHPEKYPAYSAKEPETIFIQTPHLDLEKYPDLMLSFVFRQGREKK